MGTGRGWRNTRILASSQSSQWRACQTRNLSFSEPLESHLSVVPCAPERALCELSSLVRSVCLIICPLCSIGEAQIFAQNRRKPQILSQNRGKTAKFCRNPFTSLKQMGMLEAQCLQGARKGGHTEKRTTPLVCTLTSAKKDLESPTPKSTTAT